MATFPALISPQNQKKLHFAIYKVYTLCNDRTGSDHFPWPQLYKMKHADCFYKHVKKWIALSEFKGTV